MFMAPIALETDPLYKVLIVGIKETCCDSLGLQNPEKDCRRPDCLMAKQDLESVMNLHF